MHFLRKTLSLSLAIGLVFSTFSTSASIVPFAKRSQRLLYGATETEFDIQVNRDGVTLKYKTSGTQAIAVQNYCGFWLSGCEDENWIGISPLPENLQP